MGAQPSEPDSPSRMRASLADASDAAVLDAMRDGDGSALGPLYDRHGRLAFITAYRVLGEKGAAEDVVQEAFLAVWRNADRYRADKGPVRAWLLTIVRNAAIDRRRGRHGRDSRVGALDDVAYGLEAKTPDPFSIAAARLEAEQIRTAVADLPREQRHAVELAFFGGLTHQEVAEQTGEPLGTVKGRLRLGLRKLRAALAVEVDQRHGSGPAPGTITGGGPSPLEGVGR